MSQLPPTDKSNARLGPMVDALRPVVSDIFDRFGSLSRGQALQMLVDAVAAIPSSTERDADYFLIERVLRGVKTDEAINAALALGRLAKPVSASELWSPMDMSEGNAGPVTIVTPGDLVCTFDKASGKLMGMTIPSLASTDIGHSR